MIIYEGSCDLFIDQCSSSEEGTAISEVISECMYKYNIHVGDSEPASWAKSLPALAHVLNNYGIPKEAEIAIE
ncbi:MAG: hypothetical protein IKQ14_03940 [Candidatus Methanomethylophilaceae archaeon]|nr:hypothetical protein [Candidatus Methanomethylophilaceae archaeon]